jgi:hypothetical protein
MVQGGAGVGQEPDDQVLVLADPLDALFGGVDDLSQGVVVGRLANSRSLRLAVKMPPGSFGEDGPGSGGESDPEVG